MMSLQQKVIAVGALLFIDAVFLFVAPVLGLLALFATVPMALFLLTR